MTDTSKKANSQKAAIIAYLQANGQIDMPTAWQKFGCAALRSRISDLRKEGVEIESRRQVFTSIFGHRGSFAVYFLKGFEKKVVGRSALFQLVLSRCVPLRKHRQESGVMRVISYF